MPFEVESTWFSGSCDVLTYELAELTGTKLRDEEFLADTDIILGPDVEYEPASAWTKVHDELVVRLMR